MLAAPASQKLYPYHDSPSRLCTYAAYGSPRLSGIRGAARYYVRSAGMWRCQGSASRALPRRTVDCVEN
jgi:hypothetical protein